MHSAKWLPLIFLPQDPQKSRTGPRITDSGIPLWILRGESQKAAVLQRSVRAVGRAGSPSSPGDALWANLTGPTVQPSAAGNACWDDSRQDQRILKISDCRDHCWSSECPGEHCDHPTACAFGTQGSDAPKPPASKTNHKLPSGATKLKNKTNHTQK